MDSSLPEQLRDRFWWLGPVIFALRRIERWAIAGSHGVVAVCQSLEDIVHRQSPATPILRMEDANPISMEASREHTEKILVPSATPPIILYVGNLEPYQGIDLLLDAFRYVTRQHSSATLLIVGGSAKTIRKYSAQTVRLGLTDRVVFVGPKPLEVVPHYLRLADVVVSPRLHGKNTPMKVYSYLESETPLVATRLETHTQVLDDSICWLAEPAPEDFAVAIINAWENQAKSKELAIRAKQRADSKFSPAIQDEKLRIFYDDVKARIERERRVTSTSRMSSRIHERTQT